MSCGRYRIFPHVQSSFSQSAEYPEKPLQWWGVVFGPGHLSLDLDAPTVPCPALPCPAPPHLAALCPAPPCPVLSCPAPPCPVLPHPTLQRHAPPNPCPVLLQLTLPCPAPPHSVLSHLCHTLPLLIPPCPALPCPAQPALRRDTLWRQPRNVKSATSRLLSCVTYNVRRLPCEPGSTRGNLTCFYLLNLEKNKSHPLSLIGREIMASFKIGGNSENFPAVGEGPRQTQGRQVPSPQTPFTQRASRQVRFTGLFSVFYPPPALTFRVQP